MTTFRHGILGGRRRYSGGIVYNLTVNVTRNPDGTLKAVIDWDDISGATQYQVQGDLYGTDPNTYPPGSWIDSWQQPQGTNSILILDNEADVGTIYIVRVRAMVNGVWRNWSAEVTGNSPVSPVLINILTPTQNQEVQGDFILSFELNLDTINIISPTQNQQVAGDINLEFNLE